MVNTEEILEKIRVFLEKQDINPEECYFITKKLNEEYWQVLQDEELTEDLTEEEDEFELPEELPKPEVLTPIPKKVGRPPIKTVSEGGKPKFKGQVPQEKIDIGDF